MLVLSVVILLSGCAVKFVYNQLDWLIPWYLDDYVSLNSSQEKLFEERLQQYLEWHRKEQLPVYADFLEWMAESSKDGLSLTEIDEFQSRSEQFSAELLTRLAPALLDILASLDDQQVMQLMRNLQQENEKYAEKYVETSAKKQRYRRVKEVRKFIERWTGTLDDEQMLLIRNWSQKYELMGQEFLQSRENWQRQLGNILQRRKQRDYFDQSLTELFSNPAASRSDQYQKIFKANEVLLKRLYLQLDQSLTKSQRGRMVRKFNDYAADFRELSQQSW